MTTSPYNTAPVDINVVGQSWTQTNRSAFLLDSVPTARVLDRRNGRGSTTYEIPNLDNALQKGALLDWEPGQSLPVSQTIGSTTKTLTPRGRSTRLLTDVTNRQGLHRFRDLENNKVPMLLSEAYQGVDKELFTFLTTVGNWKDGTAKLFTKSGGGTAGSPLDSPEGANPVVQPDVDINNEIRSLRVYAGIQGMSLEAWMSPNVAMALARHGVYTGAGTGSAIASQLVHDEFMRRFKAIHMLDKVVVSGVSSDTANPGQASVPAFIHDSLLWFGLVDRRGAFDLTSEESGDAPDGSIVLAMSREPEVVQFELPGTETQYYAGRTAYDIISPRGSDFGVVFSGTGAGGVLTA